MTSDAQQAGVWDPGLQAERTKLSWQRTALSTTACSLIIARFVATHSLAAGVALGLVSLLGGLAVGVTASRRYQRAVSALHAEQSIPDARMFMLMTLLLVLTGVGAMALVLTT